MVGLIAFRRDDGKTDIAARGPIRQLIPVTPPDGPAGGLNLVGSLELGVQECGQDIRRHIARSQIHPGVLVHLPAKETRAIGALLAEDLNPMEEPRIIDDQCAALAAAYVLGFVETLSR